MNHARGTLKTESLFKGAAKLIYLDNYIKIFRGYFTNISTHRHFSTGAFLFKSKCMSKVYEPSHDKTN